MPPPPPPPRAHRDHQFLNKGIGATTSGIFAVCADKMLPPDSDLVVVELTYNEPAGGARPATGAAPAVAACLAAYAPGHVGCSLLAAGACMHACSWQTASLAGAHAGLWPPPARPFSSQRSCGPPRVQTSPSHTPTAAALRKCCASWHASRARQLSLCCTTTPGTTRMATANQRGCSTVQQNRSSAPWRRWVGRAGVAEEARPGGQVGGQAGGYIQGCKGVCRLLHCPFGRSIDPPSCAHPPCTYPAPALQYYDMPSPSLRNALYPLMQADVPPYRVGRARAAAVSAACCRVLAVAAGRLSPAAATRAPQPLPQPLPLPQPQRSAVPAHPLADLLHPCSPAHKHIAYWRGPMQVGRVHKRGEASLSGARLKVAGPRISKGYVYYDAIHPSGAWVGGRLAGWLEVLAYQQRSIPQTVVVCSVARPGVCVQICATHLLLYSFADVGHQALAELLAGVVQTAVQNVLAEGKLTEGGEAAPSLKPVKLPPPMIPGTADVPTSLCAMQVGAVCCCQLIAGMLLVFETEAGCCCWLACVCW